MDAAARGAVIETRTEMVKAERRAGGWRGDCCATQERRAARDRRARCSSTPPGRGSPSSPPSRLGLPLDAPVRLVKGSHIVVPKLFEHDRAYIFQNADGRIVFAIPYEQRLHADRHHRP